MNAVFERAVYVRQLVISQYKRFETPLIYLAKFIMGLFIFSSINRYFASLGVAYAVRIDRFSAVMLAAVVTAVLPSTWVFMLMWLFVTLHIFYISLELSVIAGLLLLCLVMFYVRIFPKESYLIVLLLVCFKFKIPAFVPLFAGLFCGVGSIGALIIAPLLWCMSSQQALFGLTGNSLSELNVLSLPQNFGDTLRVVIETLSSNEAWIHYAFVFVLAAVAVLIISRLPFAYSMEAAMGVGALTIMIGLIAGMATGSIEGSALGTIFSVIFSVIFIYVCKFFYIIVDYSGVERVNFQDEEYLYYVKAVPKIK